MNSKLNNHPRTNTSNIKHGTENLILNTILKTGYEIHKIKLYCKIIIQIQKNDETRLMERRL